ncbi:hypothetical protein GCM10011409_28460 [Lentibacillus populi]|uniref:Uncharacterized protein n=1 Tax=Lentibacillus populi TaxID=1827502 RepID=A0A9W5X6P4_9BACI|nr:hypothetical protein GCM10011409_28460 [Lentibacillus populi]
MAYPVIKLSTAAKFYNFLDDKTGNSDYNEGYISFPILIFVNITGNSAAYSELYK